MTLAINNLIERGEEQKRNEGDENNIVVKTLTDTEYVGKYHRIMNESVIVQDILNMVPKLRGMRDNRRRREANRAR